ncbi:XRE family transcriptional regulator [Acinetobacter sp. B5B]|uniref:XRE family transcriptional regulator n=1 Tax=Acinetobacter baretiae TaxID=2605383 RepID=UPI0018C31C96|nr:XRE family transcriptional regulator [Acinetobacter baretiae]MBF7683876.1 XRE family transcriptional regulator [Acinetobacter baretiae]
MDIYHFTIVIRDARYQMSELEDRLFEAGCDDALLCSYNDTVYLEFDREAESAEVAIKSALANIRTAGFKELVVEENGYASLSEMADRAGMSRQAFSLYAKNQRGDGNFPTPIYGLASKTALYSWPEVATWLYQQGKLPKTHYDVARMSV